MLATSFPDEPFNSIPICCDLHAKLVCRCSHTWVPIAKQFPNKALQLAPKASHGIICPCPKPPSSPLQAS